MNRISRYRPSPAMVVACISLFVALGGVGYAAATIGSTQIKNNSVSTKDLKNNDVRSGDIRTGNVGSSDVKDNGLTGTDILESRLGKVPAARQSDSAGSAGNADRLDNADSTEFRTASAQAERTDDLTPSSTDSPVVSATITIPAQRQVMAVATVDLVGDGGTDDNLNCNPIIAGTTGIRMTQQVTSGVGDHASFALTQSRALGAGTYTVSLECGRGGASDAVIDDAALTVWATG